MFGSETLHAITAAIYELLAEPPTSITIGGLLDRSTTRNRFGSNKRDFLKAATHSRRREFRRVEQIELEGVVDKFELFELFERPSCFGRNFLGNFYGILSRHSGPADLQWRLPTDLI